MESPRFLFSYHIFEGSIVDLPRYTQMPRAYTSVTTVSHLYVIWDVCLPSLSQ